MTFAMYDDAQTIQRKEMHNNTHVPFGQDLSSLLQPAPMVLDWGLEPGQSVFGLGDDLLSDPIADWLLLPPAQGLPEAASKLIQYEQTKIEAPRPTDNLLMINMEALHSDSDTNPSASDRLSLEDTDTSSEYSSREILSAEPVEYEYTSTIQPFRQQMSAAANTCDRTSDDAHSDEKQQVVDVPCSPAGKRKASVMDDAPAEAEPVDQHLESNSRRTSARVQCRRENQRLQEQDTKSEVSDSSSKPVRRGRGRTTSQSKGGLRQPSDQKSSPKDAAPTRKKARVSALSAETAVVEDKEASPEGTKTAPKGVRRKKDKNLPRKGRTAFILFLLDFRAKHKQENNTPEAFSELSKRVGLAWSTLPELERAKYIRRGAQEAAQYKREKAAYLAKKAAEAADQDL